MIGGEREADNATISETSPASTEPPTVIGGELIVRPEDDRVLQASTEPPTVIGGELGELAADDGDLVASTEPPTVIGGEATDPVGHARQDRRFNGAADGDRRRGRRR